MQNVHTAVIARRVPISGPFQTLPFEAGWALESIVFVQVEGSHPDLSIRVEVSPDGLIWLQRGDAVLLAANSPMIEIPLVNFGNWIRVNVDGASEQTGAKLLIHMVMKG